MPESVFLVLWNFLLFFLNFLPRVEHERNSGLKFFFLFLGLSHPIFAKNNTGKRLFNFLNCFALFFGIFFPGSSMNGIFCYFFRNFLVRIEKERNLRLNFFSLFLGLYHLILAKNNVRKSFLIFFNFLLFFSEFSCPGRVWTEFWSKFLFSLSAYIIPFWLKIMPEIGFLIF